MSKLNVGSVKGFMVNARTKRIRVYGTLADIGIDFDAKLSPPVQYALRGLFEAFEDQYGCQGGMLTTQECIAENTVKLLKSGAL